MSRPLSGIGRNALVALFMVLLIVVWEQGVRIFEIKRYLLPPPSEVLRALAESRSFLLDHSLDTIVTVLLGFSLAVLLGCLLAVGMLFVPLLARVMQPLIVISQTLPTVITAPMLLIWIGFTMTTRVIATVLNAFFPIVVALYDGLRTPEQEQVEMLAAAGATPWQIFVKLRLPASLPMLFAGLKVASTSAVTGAMVGELIVGQRGLGYYVRSMAGQLEMADVFAAVSLVSLIGVTFYLAMAGLERVVMPWYFMDRDRNQGG